MAPAHTRKGPGPLSVVLPVVAVSKWVAERPLFFIVVVALLLRMLDAVFFTGAIDYEGAEYARLAQNLLSGVGYVGTAEEGPQLFFPPILPFMIAGLSLITGDAEIAGRTLCVAIGALKLMFGALIRAAEIWRGLRFTEFELRQLDAVRNDLDAKYEASITRSARPSQPRSSSKSMP